MNVANTILQQLGGNKFIAMTGSKNFLSADISETTPDPWLRMDLAKNKAGVNKLQIILRADDTYTMFFYKQVITKSFEVKFSNEKEFNGIYSDMLANIFTQVTGFDTTL